MQTPKECGRPQVLAGWPPKHTALGFGAGFPPATPRLGAGLLRPWRGPILALPGVFAGLPAAALSAGHQERRGRLCTCGAAQRAAQARPPPPTAAGASPVVSGGARTSCVVGQEARLWGRSSGVCTCVQWGVLEQTSRAGLTVVLVALPEDSPWSPGALAVLGQCPGPNSD